LADPHPALCADARTSKNVRQMTLGSPLPHNKAADAQSGAKSETIVTLFLFNDDYSL